MLPADFEGEPASAVSASVDGPSGVAKGAARPRLSLEWLTSAEGDLDGSALVGQPLSFRWSNKLETDWEIGLALPAEAVKFEAAVGGMRNVRIGIGKIVYFDDRVPDGRLDWSCAAPPACDEAKAGSAEIVVYVETPPTCQGRAGELRARIAPGYHYFRFEGGTLREVAAERQSVTFTVTGRALGAPDVVAELRAFTTALLRSWSLGALDGC
jgi:hypothetical protein